MTGSEESKWGRERSKPGGQRLSASGARVLAWVGETGLLASQMKTQTAPLRRHAILQLIHKLSLPLTQACGREHATERRQRRRCLPAPVLIAAAVSKLSPPAKVVLQEFINNGFGRKRGLCTCHERKLNVRIVRSTYNHRHSIRTTTNVPCHTCKHILLCCVACQTDLPGCLNPSAKRPTSAVATRAADRPSLGDRSNCVHARRDQARRRQPVDTTILTSLANTSVTVTARYLVTKA
jgi:hypothetical protein